LYREIGHQSKILANTNILIYFRIIKSNYNTHHTPPQNIGGIIFAKQNFGVVKKLEENGQNIQHNKQNRALDSPHLHRSCGSGANYNARNSENRQGSKLGGRIHNR
jgi:hypothetical protein